MGFIYKITNKVNGKIYIGQTKRDINVRWLEHIRHAGKEKSMPILRAIAKYGVKNFYIEEVENCFDQDLDKRENYWIKKEKTFDKKIGYNIAVDSPVYSKYTNEDKQIILDKWNEGSGIVKIAKETNFNVETVRLHLNKNNITKKDIKNRANRNNALSKSKRIYQYTLDGHFIKEWESAAEAGRELKINRSSINAVTNKRAKTAGGFRWCFSKNIKKTTQLPPLKKEKGRQIIQYDLDNNFIKEWASITEAATYFIENNLIKTKKISSATKNIYKALNKELKTAYKYKWKYKE